MNHNCCHRYYMEKAATASLVFAFSSREIALNEWSTVGTYISKNEVSIKATAAAKELGYDKLKELQLRVVIGLCQGRGVLAVLPTGYGENIQFHF